MGDLATGRVVFVTGGGSGIGRAAAVMFAAIIVYSIFGGADFGSGVWDLLAGRGRQGAHLRRDPALGARSLSIGRPSQAGRPGRPRTPGRSRSHRLSRACGKTTVSRPVGTVTSWLAPQ